MTGTVLVFPDSNILFSAAYLPNRRLARMWEIPGVDMLVCRYTLDETIRNLRRPEQRSRLWSLVYRSHLVADAAMTELPAGVALAEKDRPVLLTALAAGAHVLVTGDRQHFRELFGTRIGGVQIESFADFRSRYPGIFESEPERQ